MRTILTRLFALFCIGVFITSCGGVNSFNKAKSGKLRKVRFAKESTVQSEKISDESAQAFIESPAESEPVSGTVTLQELPATDDPIINESENTNSETATNTQIKQQDEAAESSSKAPTRQTFDNNHFLSLGALILGLAFSAAGYVMWSSPLYIIGFLFMLAGLVLAALLKFKISKEVPSADDDGAYQRRLWFANFLFYSAAFIIFLLTIAIIIIAMA